MNIKQSLFVLLCFLSLKVGAQDVHFSYYQFAPTTVSPALTGAYYGNIRATILRRSQWFNVGNTGNDGFNTNSLLLDGNIPFGFKEGDWVSAGVNYMQEDQTAGVLDLQRGFTGISAAYHMTMGKKKSSVLTFSGKYGKYSNAFQNMFGDRPNPTTPKNIVDGDPTGALVDADEQEKVFGEPAEMGTVTEDATDIHIGLMYSTPVGKKSDLRIGLSSDHLFAPRLNSQIDSITGLQTGARVNRRFNIFAQLYTDLNSKLTFNPTLLYQSMGSASNLLLQGLFSYHHNKSKDLYLNFGMGVRVASNMDVPIYLGADYKDWRIGLSFDLNLTGLSGSTSNAGAYELGISKIFSWNKKAKVNPKLICPRL